MSKPCEKYREYKICYNCGKITCNERNCLDENCPYKYAIEHIPPKSFFKQDRIFPTETTVDCCRECNNNYSADDDYWLNIITIHASNYSSTAKSASQTKRLPAIVKYNNKLRMDMVQSYRLMNVKTQKGIYVGRTGGIDLDTRKFDSVNIKIIKGYFYKNFGEILKVRPLYKWSNMPHSKNEEIIIYNDEVYANLIAAIKSGIIDAEQYQIFNKIINTFQYGYITNFPDENSMLFFLEFYDCVQFLYQIKIK